MKVKKKPRVKKLASINKEEKEIPDNVIYSSDGEYMFYSSSEMPIIKNITLKSILKQKNSKKDGIKYKLLTKLKKTNSSISDTDISKQLSSSNTLNDIKTYKRVRFALEKLTRVAEKEEDEKEELESILMSPDKMLHIYNQVCENKSVQPLQPVTEALKKENKHTVKIDLHGIQLNAFNTITVLSGILFYNFGLELLNVSNCGLNDERITMILCAVETSASLQSLNISHNELVSDAGIRRLCEAIRKLKSIKILDLSGIPLTEQKTLNCLSHCFQIQKQFALSNAPSTVFYGLQTLKLDGVDLNKAFQLQSLACGIRNSNIKYLSLRKNKIDEAACFGLMRLFSAYSYDPKSEKNHIKYLEKMCSDSFRDKEIDLREHLKKLSVVYLNDNVQGSNGLWVLDLSYNSIKYGVFLLMELLKSDLTIRQLNLSHNLIERDSCESIFTAIETNTTLEILDLSHNLIGGCEEDFSNLRQNDKTKKTEERDDYSEYIVDALIKNKTLKSLSLAYCKLHFNSLLTFASEIREFHGLRLLDLRGNIFRYDALKTFTHELSFNKIMTKVEISIAAIRSASQSRLEELLIKLMSICTSNLENQIRQAGGHFKICSTDQEIENLLMIIDDQVKKVDDVVDLIVDSEVTFHLRLNLLSNLRINLMNSLSLLQLLPSMINIEKFQCIYN